MEDNTLFDFSVGISFYAGNGVVWYQADIWAADSRLPPPAPDRIGTMYGHMGYPPSFPADTPFAVEMKRRIIVEVTSKIQPAWQKLLAVIAKKPTEHVCDDYMCAECGTDKLLTRRQVAERNLREGKGFIFTNETDEEWEAEKAKWLAVIAEEDAKK
jgi:hypothetical protein